MRTSLDVTFGRGFGYEQRVVWPILETTPKAWRIQTEAGEVWVPSYRWSCIRPGPGASPDEQRLNGLLEFFGSITSTNGDARVAVRRAGKGPSELSVKVSFNVVVHRPDGLGILGERRRTVIIPASQLSLDGDPCSVPRWVLARKLGPNESFQVRPLWPGLPALQDQLRKAFDAAMAGEAAEKEARRIAALKAGEERAARDRIAAEAKSVRSAMVAEDGELALAFARRRLTLQELRELGCGLHAWPQWLPGEPVNELLEGALARIIRAVRGHPRVCGVACQEPSAAGCATEAAQSGPGTQA